MELRALQNIATERDSRACGSSRVAALVGELEGGVAARQVDADAHGLRELPELYNEAQAGAEQHHIAGVLLHQVQEDDDLRQQSDSLETCRAFSKAIFSAPRLSPFHDTISYST